MITEKDLQALNARVGLGVQAPLQDQVAKVSKMRNIKVTLEGRRFDSTLEARAYVVLKAWEAAGAISGLELQSRYEIHSAYVVAGRKVRKIEYVPDFRFIKDGVQYVVDAKGCETEVFKIKRKLFEARFPELRFECWNKATVKDMERR